MQSLSYKKRNKGDVSILIVTAMLAFFGVVMVYSASSYNAEIQYGDQFFFMKKQLLGFAIGLPMMLFVARVNPQWLRGKKVRWVFLLLPALLLALVFVPGVGKKALNP